MNETTDRSLRLIDAAGLGLCLALSAGLYFAAVRPVLNEQLARRQQAAALAEQQRRADELGVMLADRRQTLQQTEQFVASRPLKLVPLAQLNQRLAQITACADACDLLLDRIEPARSRAGEHYVTVPIHMAGRGSYSAAAKLLDELHANWPDLAVASLDLQGNPRQTRDEPRFALELLWFAAPDS